MQFNKSHVARRKDPVTGLPLKRRLYALVEPPSEDYRKPYGYRLTLVERDEPDLSHGTLNRCLMMRLLNVTTKALAWLLLLTCTLGVITWLVMMSPPDNVDPYSAEVWTFMAVAFSLLLVPLCVFHYFTEENPNSIVNLNKLRDRLAEQWRRRRLKDLKDEGFQIALGTVKLARMSLEDSKVPCEVPVESIVWIQWRNNRIRDMAKGLVRLLPKDVRNRCITEMSFFDPVKTQSCVDWSQPAERVIDWDECEDILNDDKRGNVNHCQDRPSYAQRWPSTEH